MIIKLFFDFNLLYLELDDPNFQAYYSLLDHQTSSIDDSYYFIYPIHQQNKQLYAILVYPYKFNNHLNAFDFHYLISTDQNAITNYAKQYYNLSPLTLQSNNNQTFYFYSMLEMNVYYRLFYQKIIEYLLFFLITFFILLFMSYYFIINIKKRYLKVDETYQQELEQLEAINTQNNIKFELQINELVDKLNQSKLKITRLSYDRKNEIDPDDYEYFLNGIKTLTKTEKKIFNYYLEGKDLKEILTILNIKETTLRYHNRNIYSKLGINSLKQLIRYGALMQNENP